MAIIDDTVYSDIVEEIASSPKNSNFKYYVNIEVKGQLVMVRQLSNLDRNFDFENKYTEETTAELVINVSDYERFIYPNKDDLYVNIKRVATIETDKTRVLDIPVQVMRYNAIIGNGTDRDLMNTPSYDPSTMMSRYTFTLIPILVEQVRMRSFGTILRHMTTLDAIVSTMSTVSADLNVPSDSTIVGVHTFPTHNTQPRETIMIPPYVKAFDIPRFIQLKRGGVYNTDLGSFLWNRRWYIYPIYSTNNYSTTRYIADIIMVPQSKMAGLRRSFQIKSEKLQILATGDTISNDSSTNASKQTGDGARFILGSELVNNFVTVSGNKAVTNFINVQGAVTLKKDNTLPFQYAPFITNPITDNVPAVLSELAPKNGEWLYVKWESCNVELLYPGMPVRVLHGSDKRYTERYGVLLGIIESTSTLEAGLIADSVYQSVCILKLFLEKKEEE